MGDYPSIPGITLDKRLHEGPIVNVYRGVREVDGAAVAIKGYRGPDALVRARRERDVLRRCVDASIPAFHDLDSSQSVPFLVTALAPGESLAGFVARGLPSIGDVLRVATHVTRALGVVHEQRAIHCNITPTTIMVDRGTLETHLIGFGWARTLGAAQRLEEAHLQGRPDRVAFIAPEQTSRTDRGLDARCDLYMLGATLYFALTGRPPFAGVDPAELVLCHLARQPEPPSCVRPEIPAALSALVCRLLEKEPGRRYQSAGGLLADLERMTGLWSEHGSLEGLTLGGAEVPDRPRFTDRVIGRDTEIEILREAYTAVRSGAMRVVLLSGPAGSGKSTLVNAIRRWVADRQGGYLGGGKFDHYIERPYSGWIQALDSVVQQQLLESDAALGAWATELRAGLGAIARAVVDLVPDLGLVMGPVEDLPRLDPRATQVRLALAVERLLRTWARPDRPIVLFLDDLQWLDADSRVLLDLVLSSGEISHLLLVGAYRTDDPAQLYPLRRQLHALERRGVVFEHIDVGALPVDSIAEILAGALCCEIADARALAEEAERRTGGSPLLVRQFISHLFEQELLEFRGGRWSWDADAVSAASIPENAVALMSAEIDRVPKSARSVLQFASCIGDEVDAHLLVRLGVGAEAQVESALHTLCDAGLLVPSARGLRFAHDRIRESAQAQLSSETRAHLHYKTGLWLLEKSNLDDDVALFEVVEHLNRGRDDLDERRRLEVIALDLRAGRRALAAGTAAHANALLRCALELACEGDWAAERSLLFELHLTAAESAFLTGDLEGSLALLEPLDRRVETLLESAQVAARRIYARALRDRPHDVTRDALRALRKLGIRWPLHPSPLRARLGLRLVRWLLQRPRRGVLSPPRGRLPDRIVAILLILKASGGARARGDYLLAVCSTCFVLRESLRRGVIGAPSYFLAAYASQVRALLGDGAESARAARLAEEWVERAPDPVYGLRARQQLYTQVHPWMMPRRAAFEPTGPLIEQLREAGDAEFTFYTRVLHACYSALAGDPVRVAMAQMQTLVDEVERSGFQYADPVASLAAFSQIERAGSSSAALRAELDAQRAVLEGGELSAQTYAYALWMMVLCTAGDDARALALSLEFGDRLWRGVAGVQVADHVFYRGVAAARLAHATRRGRFSRYARVLEQATRLLARWSRFGPDFVHMEMLLSAERALLQRDASRAEGLYEAAARSAAAQSFIHHAALAHERRASLLREAGRADGADTSLCTAIDFYRAWGVEAKAAALEATRGRDLRPPSEPRSTTK